MDASQVQRLNEDRSLTGWFKAHDLLLFFVLAFLITFAGWVPVLLALPGSDVINIIGMWGPAIAAVLVTALTRGRAGLRALFGSLFRWRVPARWYLVILFGLPAITVLSVLLYTLITHQPLIFQPGQWTQTLGWLIQALILGFWACEEIGWRGFALPRLLSRWNALLASVILGIVWALWHLPYYLLMDMPVPFTMFMVYTVSLSILMTWVFNHTLGSVFVATCFHFWVNIVSGIQADKLPVANPGGLEVVQDWVQAAAAVGVVVLFGYRSLTRERKNALPAGLKPREV